MLNYSGYDEFLIQSPSSVRSEIKDFLGCKKSFLYVDDYPETTGLYFVYLASEVLYIGKSSERTIKEDCLAHTSPDVSTELKRKISYIKKTNESEVSRYIEKNFCTKFLFVKNNDKASLLQQISVWAFQPKLNSVSEQFFQNGAINLSVNVRLAPNKSGLVARKFNQVLIE